MWSNSHMVSKFRTKKLKRSKCKPGKPMVKRYRNKEGKIKVQGDKKQLKASANLECTYCCWNTMPGLYVFSFGRPCNKKIVIYLFCQTRNLKVGDEPVVISLPGSFLPRRYPLGFCLRYLQVFNDLQLENEHRRKTFEACDKDYTYRSCYWLS